MRLSLGTRYLIVGIGLMVLSVALAFMMVLQILPSTFWLNGLTYLASLIGLILGVVGVAYQVQFTRRR
jgi:NADH:ubiquinone oxidoreductase subunit 3 (subunit A)